MENNEEKDSSKLSLWSSAIWTFTWVIAAFVLLIVSINSLINSGFQNFESLVFVLGLFIFLIYILIVNIKQIKALRKKYYSSNTATQSLVVEKLSCEQWFYEKYRQLSIKRCMCICIFPFLSLLVVIVVFLFAVVRLDDWESRVSFTIDLFLKDFSVYLYITSIFLIFSLVFVLWLSLRVSRNLRLLKEMYEYADSEDCTQLEHIAVGGFAFVFTKTYFLNWDGTLHVVRLKDIKQIQYKKYYWYFITGTRLVIMDSFGRKYTIMEYGPSVEEWRKHGLLHYVVKGHKDGKVYREVHFM